MLLVNRQIPLLQGISSARRVADEPKALVVPKEKLFELQRDRPKQPVSIFTHRHTSDTVRALEQVRLSRDSVLRITVAPAQRAAGLPTFWNEMTKCMGGRDQRQFENLCKVPAGCR